MSDSKYLLSVLAPTYNYIDGIERSLSNLPFGELNSFECIVYDNSNDEKLYQQLKSKYSRFTNFKIVHFDPPTTPAVNWNGLLKAASGKYLILLHHDEFFSSKKEFKGLINSLVKCDEDLIMLNFAKCRINAGFKYLHLPFFLRVFLLKNIPQYLLYHNFIGPTGCLVIRSNSVKFFDEKLKWLIDVEWYLKILYSTKKISFLNNITILSGVDNHLTLTKSLDGQIPKLIDVEMAIIKDSFEKKTNYFLLEYFKQPFIRCLDRGIWWILRVLLIPWVLCSIRKFGKDIN